MADRPLQVSGTEAPGWSQLNNLSCSTLGSQIIFATDDWFAEAENLLVPEAAVWQAEWSTLIGRDPSRLFSDWLKSYNLYGP